MDDECAIIGTCTEMCPKQERELRIRKGLVSSFEPDQSKMIKEYRRPAAGQETSPAELRTEEALVRTMDYITAEIVDKFESSSKGVWYTFIWDRMRAIRKDITIQRLTGPAIIEMLERTARFHILCSYWLCEEQGGVFDFKLNEDSLVHCIQLLRGMYAEADREPAEANGAGQQNRAEFLCYHILRTLDEKQLVNEISSIDTRILQSDHLRFAIQAFVAYRSSNYCAFMRLLLDASLLQACILNRYLPRVRRTAFRLLKLATSSRAPMEQTRIPQDYFMKALLFKENELAKFCKSIKCDLVNQTVLFSKNKEIASDDSFTLERNALVDRKFAKLKLSGIVNGSVQKEISSVTELSDLFNRCI